MFKPRECGDEARFKLIKQFARNSRLKVMLRNVSACQCSLGAMSKYHRCQLLTLLVFTVQYLQCTWMLLLVLY